MQRLSTRVQKKPVERLYCFREPSQAFRRRAHYAERASLLKISLAAPSSLNETRTRAIYISVFDCGGRKVDGMTGQRAIPLQRRRGSDESGLEIDKMIIRVMIRYR